MSHPVTLIVGDDLQRNRATVFFRLLLAIPHFVWLFLWGLAAFLAVVVNWLVTLVRATPPSGVHRFVARYLRYAIHVSAYVNLLADPYPSFGGSSAYPVDLEVAPPARQNRWTVFFRGLLAIPGMLMAIVLTGNVGEGSESIGGLLVTVAFLGWFASLARGRMPRGMRDAGAYALAYGVQLSAYLFVLTDRYPNSDPLAALRDLPTRADPIRLEVADDRRRSRLTTFFRLLLAIPHIVWLTLWGIAALLALVASWFATLVAGRTPAGLHRFLAAYLRYMTHVSAYLYLTANPFPGFTGAPGYPVDLAVAGPERQNRWTVAFRIVLAFPALLIAGAYSGVIAVAAVLGWFAAMVRGEMPLGLRNASALSLHYTQQAYGYVFLLTAAYPYSGPAVAAPAPATEPEPFLPPDALSTPA